MSAKGKRFLCIKSVIASKKIKGQEDLLEELLLQGHTVTQATLSRDLKELKVIKEPHADGNYYYTLSSANFVRETASASFLPDEVGIGFSGSTAVVRTRSGYAGSIASEIDLLMKEELLGCVAGDDTIILVARENISRKQIVMALERIIKVVVIR